MAKLVQKEVVIGEISFSHVNEISGDAKFIVDGAVIHVSAKNLAEKYEVREDSKPSEEEKGEEI